MTLSRKPEFQRATSGDTAPFVGPEQINVLMNHAAQMIGAYPHIQEELGFYGDALEAALDGPDDDAYMIAYVQALAVMLAATLRALQETRGMVDRLIAPSMDTDGPSAN